MKARFKAAGAKLWPDGGDARQFGWGRFNPNLKTVAGSPKMRIDGQVLRLRMYNRYLRTSEAIASYRAGF